MTKCQRFMAYVVLCSIAVTSVGCASMKTIRTTPEPGAPTFGKLKAGDTVVVRNRDGKTARFIVQQIEGDTIIAPGGERYRAADISELKRRSFSGVKTSVLVGGIFAGMYILWAAAAVAALGSWS